MPLELPNLDDLTYDDLVTEALSAIPTYTLEWTNYNPSDPGITLIELFAYLTEMLLYRLNRVTDNNRLAFLKLLRGPGWRHVEGRSLEDEIQETMLQIRTQERVITCADFENLALKADPCVARTLCLANRDFRMGLDCEREGHIGLIVVPKADQENQLSGNSGILATVKKNLEKRQLLTTHLHVAPPRYLEIEVHLTIVRLPDVETATLQTIIRNCLQTFLHPLHGGENNKGWKFGQNVYVSEINQLIDQMTGVDYITAVEINPTNSTFLDRQIWHQNNLVGLQLKPYELVKLVRTQINVEPPKE